jgi:putative hydrolase of HD superfamily
MKKLTNFLFEIGTLRKTARSHRQTLLTDDLSDNIASHSFRVSIIGMFLAQLEKADVKKVMMMCLIHDTSETRSGDQNWVHKKYLKVFEDEIIGSQLSFLPKNSEVVKASKEYQKRKSLEAKVAKDADLLDQLLLLKEYAWQGNLEAKQWLEGKHHQGLMFTNNAKKIAREIQKQKPSDWWRAQNGGWSSRRR